MAQPQQQQYQMPPQRAFSPPQPSVSPPNQAFSLPPTKRQRLSPNPPSEPGSPYNQSPYMSPATIATPMAGGPPMFSNVQLPNVYNTPYQNGGHTNSPLGQTQNLPPTMSLPQSQPSSQAFAPPPMNFQNQSQMGLQIPLNNYAMTPQAPGAMGPPSKPAEKTKEDGQDVMDILSGTGVDLREEEQFTFQQFSQSFNSQLTGSQAGNITPGHSFTQFAPGDEASLYGSGPANASAEQPNAKTQDDFHQRAANKAWQDAAQNLAISRNNELNNPFLQVGLVHSRIQKIARDNGLLLRETAQHAMGTMRLPNNFPQRDVKVQTVMGPDTAFTTTTGNFLPADSMVVDQLALLSIATKHRLRALIEDAEKLARGRQNGSHGLVPEAWRDIAAPSDPAAATVVSEGAVRSGWESAVSPHSNPRKRSWSAANPTLSSAKATTAGITELANEVSKALRADAKKERDFEEARLLKRQARANGDKTGGTPRAGSIVPGTPGSIAPDMSEKAPTKKEAKKKAEAKVNEAASHAAANSTTAQFFGKKKKKYSWMDNAGGASGASTPGRIMTSGLPGTPTPSTAPVQLTVEGVRRIGNWREGFNGKGKDIQMRDWIAVLEDDGHEKKALQKAYLFLDQSDPK